MLNRICLRILPVLFIIFACADQPIDRTAYTIDEVDLIPEGIAFSASRNAFYLSSLSKMKIVEIDAATGEHRDFIPNGAAEMLVLGLAVDDARNTLWACAEDARSEQPRAAVLRYDLESRSLVRRYEQTDSLRFTINDCTLDSHGNVYFTNRANHSVYKIDITTDAVSLLLKSEEMDHPNGIAISTDDRMLYVACAAAGIRIIDLSSGTLLPQDVAFSTSGIDGLAFYEGALYAVQNGVADAAEIKILRCQLDESLSRIIDCNILDQGNAHFDVPTTLTVADDAIYCIANSQLSNFSVEGVRDTTLLKPVHILKYPLK